MTSVTRPRSTVQVSGCASRLGSSATASAVMTGVLTHCSTCEAALYCVCAALPSLARLARPPVATPGVMKLGCLTETRRSCPAACIAAKEARGAASSVTATAVVTSAPQLPQPCALGSLDETTWKL